MLLIASSQTNIKSSLGLRFFNYLDFLRELKINFAMWKSSRMVKYLLLSLFEMQASCRILYIIIPKHKIKEIANIFYLVIDIHKNVVSDVQCASLSKEKIFIAFFTYYESSQECHLARNGRIILEVDDSALTYIKRKQYLFLLVCFLLQWRNWTTLWFFK